MKTKKELDEDFDMAVEEMNPSYAESGMLYALKNYIDARLRLIENKKQNATNDN